MKNKIYLKKYFIYIFLIFIFFLSLNLQIHIHEYQTYTKNYNEKIESILLKVKEKYPEVSESELIEILNSEKKETHTFLESYGIDVEQETVLLKNKHNFYKYLCLNGILFSIIFITFLILFLKYNHKKDKEIRNITKLIEEINHKNYSLHIEDLSEDELSILKNEIYKTTIMLKEQAENALKDKKNLKVSLEDISHQLKTPLTSILIILDNLIDDPDMEKSIREDFIRDIKREVSNINFLVQSLLKLSKFDASAITFIKEKRCISDIVNESIQNVSTLCDLKNIDIVWKGNKDIKMTCDFMWQVEAITNILKNAIDHSKENSEIHISYNQNNVYSSISILNEGEIDKEDLPYIFERFYKGKNASKDSIGIGLALSKTIIEKEGGTISVHSSNNKTNFIIKYYHI